MPVKFIQLQLNVFDDPNPLQESGEKERLPAIPIAIADSLADANKNIQDIDVISFDEVWKDSDKRVKQLRTGLKSLGFVHQTGGPSGDSLPRPSPRGLNTMVKNGGLMIVSRHPIVEERSKRYEACEGKIYNEGDCWVNKGVAYAKIKKCENDINCTYVHVFVTHMNSGHKPEHEEARTKQSAELYKYIQGMNIPKTEPVIVAGDLNIDNVKTPSVFDAFIQRTRLSPFCPNGAPQLVCMKRIGGVQYTSDPTENPLVGRDGGASDGGCLMTYKEALADQNRFGACGEACPPGQKCYKRHTKNSVCMETSGIENGKACDTSGQCNSGCCSYGVSDWNLGTCEKNTWYRKCHTSTGGLIESASPASYRPEPSTRLPCKNVSGSECYCPCCAGEWLDYLMFSREHLPSRTQPTLEVIKVRTHTPLPQSWEGPINFGNVGVKATFTDSNMSDHYGVLGTFEFTSVISK